MRTISRITAPVLLACLALSHPLASQEEKSDSESAEETILPEWPRLTKFIKAMINNDKKKEDEKQDTRPTDPPKEPSDYTPREETAEEAEENRRLTAEAAAEAKRKADAIYVARNNEYMSEFVRIQVEDASTLRFLDSWCTNNDNPSGDCMNTVTRARKVDERMKALLAKDGAEKYFREGLKTNWRPESPLRAAAVTVYGQDNSGNQAARDQYAKLSLRDNQGGFGMCKSERAALVEYHGTTEHADAIETAVRYSWSRDKLNREIAAISATASGLAAPLEKAFQLCTRRARHAELALKELTPQQVDKVIADAKATTPVAPKVETPPKVEVVSVNSDYQPVSALQGMLKDASNQPPPNTAAIGPSQTAASMTTVTGEDGKSIGPSGPPIPEPKKKKIGLGNLIMGAAQGYMQYKAIKSGVDAYPGSVGGAMPSPSTSTYPQSRQAVQATGVRGTVNPETGCISVTNGRRTEPFHTGSDKFYEVETRIAQNNCPYRVGISYNLEENQSYRTIMHIEVGSSRAFRYADIVNGKRELNRDRINTNSIFGCRTDKGYGFNSGLMSCHGP